MATDCNSSSRSDGSGDEARHESTPKKKQTTKAAAAGARRGRTPSADSYRSVCRRTGIRHQPRIGDELRQTDLGLAHRHVGSASAYPLAVSLASNTCVKRLDLSYNSLGGEGGKQLFAALIPNYTVVELDISGNDLGRTEAVAFLAELMRRNAVIKHLNISRNGFSEDDGKYVAAGIKDNERLESLNASHNEFRSWGAKFLGRALTINDTLEELDLSWNHIRKDGAVAIGLGMQNNFGLKTLLLSANGFAYEGSVGMQHALERNRTLTRLDLSGNNINWDGALMFAEALEVNDSLEELIVGDNPLTTTGAMDLVDAVSSNQSSALRLLDISGVSVTKDFLDVAVGIRENRPAFSCRYGSVVNSPDVLGARKPRQPHPMAKVMKAIADRQLRPLEVVRDFDKSVSFHLDSDEFAKRVKKFAKALKSWEIKELVPYIQESDERAAHEDDINHVTFTRSVNRYTAEERDYRIQQRKKAARIRKRKQDTLHSVTLPPLDLGNSITSISADLETSAYTSDVVKKFLGQRRPGFP